MPVRFLISKKQYLASGIYIGTKQKTKDMKEFIFEIRPDGLYLFNLRKTDERIRIAANFISRSKNVLLASRKKIAFSALETFSKITGIKVVTGRFIPGTLTNPKYEGFYEADLVFVVDPLTDYKVVEEALKAQVPIMAICNSFNETRGIDFIIPANNSSRRALATLFWILAREILKIRGEIKNYREYKYSIKDFEGVEEKS
jgi:small subunit ribosomal protein S2